MDGQDENQKTRQRHEEMRNGNESIHYRPRVVTPATLKHQRYTIQPNSEFFKDYVMFVDNVIENKPIIQQTLLSL